MRTNSRLLLALLIAIFIPALIGADSSIDEEQAQHILATRIQKDGLYNGRISMECVSFILEESSAEFLDFALREKHGGKCPGDPSTAPVIDRFRLNRQTKDIQWHEPVEGEFLPYAANMKQRSR